MSWEKSPLSLHSGSTSDVMTESARAFSALVDTDPVEMFNQYRFKYSALINNAVATKGAEAVSDDTIRLVRAGIIDTVNVVEQAFVAGNLSRATIADRIGIVTHPTTVASFGLLAARDQEGKDTAIAAYAGGKPALVLGGDNAYITTNLRARNGDRVCPFAGEEPSPLFKKFIRWGGIYAVHADDPSYRRRNKLD